MSEDPLFVAIPDADEKMTLARATAARTLDRFRVLVRSATAAEPSAKLRFRDPDASADAGQDRFFYLWLCAVVFHEQEDLYSGEFFEVPDGFEKYHPVGSRLGFAPEDIFDWMVNDEGTVHGAFTIRVVRQRLPAGERAELDRHVGAVSYSPDDFDAVLAQP